ncbi:MAG: DUF4097 domain-containing protein [Candidatus Hodarchaeota archaeon]
METKQLVLMHKHWFAMGILCLILVMGLSGCIGQTGATEEFRETYDVDAGTVLQVDNINGDITVTKWDNDQVEVYALKRAFVDESDLDKVSIEVSTGNVMVVKTKYAVPTEDIEVSVAYTIKVPADVNVELLGNTNGRISLEGTTGDAMLTNTNGDVSVKNVDGSVFVTNTNGKIDIVDVTGVLGAMTTNGDVTVELPALSSDVIIGTTNGKVKVYIPDDLDADVKMTTSNGEVTVHDIQLTIMEQSEIKVEGTMGDGGFDLIITSTNGDIDLYKL